MILLSKVLIGEPATTTFQKTRGEVVVDMGDFTVKAESTIEQGSKVQ